MKRGRGNTGHIPELGYCRDEGSVCGEKNRDVDAVEELTEETGKGLEGKGLVVLSALMLLHHGVCLVLCWAPRRLLSSWN